MKGEAINVAYELEELAATLGAALVLLDLLQHKGLPTLEIAERVPATVTSLLVLVKARLELVCKVTQGVVDPALLLADHNRALEPSPADDGQALILKLWSAAEQSKHLRQEVSRIKIRQGASHAPRARSRE